MAPARATWLASCAATLTVAFHERRDVVAVVAVRLPTCAVTTGGGGGGGGATALTVVVTDAALFVMSVSASFAATLARFESVPAAAGRAVTVTVACAPTPRLPSAQ